MCVRINFATRVVTPWDPSRRTITVPASLSAEHVLLAVRATLIELGVPQSDGGGAICWCGEAVPIRAGWGYTLEMIRIGA